MGFVVGTAVTTNADFTKYAFEQSLTNLLRSGNTYSDLHVGAVNTLIAEHLEPKGYTTAAKLSAITNTDSFKPALTFWVLAQIFTGQGQSARREDERQQALSKADEYSRRYRESLSKVAIVTSDGKARTQRGLPIVANQDRGTRYPALGSGGELARGAQPLRGEIDDFDGTVIEGT